MSLIVLSNSNTNQKDIDSNWNKPYSFHNSMKETMIIPPHSEVAVVSVKCNKDNLAVIDPGDTFFTMFGPDMRSEDYKNKTMDDTTVDPVLVQPLLATSSYLNDRTVVIKEESVSINVYKERLQGALERGWGLYPDLAGNSQVDFHYDSGIFAGFKIGTAFGDQQGDTNLTKDLTTWKKWNRDTDHNGLIHSNEVVDAQTFAKISSPASQSGVRNEENVSVGTDFKAGPMSLRRGEIRFDIYGVCDPAELPANYKVNTDCAFGLVRPQGNDINPPNFDSNVGTLETVDRSGQKQFYDYCIRMERKTTGTDRYLWVGVSAPYQNTLPGENFKEIQMDEIKYYGWSVGDPADASDFETQYNMSTNTLNINQFKIELNNENVCFWYHTGAIDHLATGSGSTNNGGAVGEWKKLCSQTQSTKEKWETDAKHGRTHYPPPLGQQNWVMYPKVYIHGLSRHIVISKYGGIPNKFVYGDPLDCWACRMYNIGQSEKVAELECRDAFVVPYEIDSPGYYAQSGEVSTGSKLPFEYTYTLVTEPDEQIQPTGQANMGRQLGFTNNVVTPSTSPAGEPANPSGNLYQYTSTAIPDLTGDSSMFVRLDNLTQRSFNGGVGRPSKIIYMLPRFDNSGNSQGTGLFYSPGERVYLQLGNTEPLYLNEFAITMCDENEILVDTLTGNTIVILHIRQSDSRSMGHLDNKPFRTGAPQL